MDAGLDDAGTVDVDAGGPSLLDQMDAFLQANEEDGVTRDPRALSYPTEEIRLTVAPQILGYAALWSARGDPRYAEEVESRARFLVEHIDEAVSGGPFDGMLAYALLAAWEITGDAETRAAGALLVDACLALPDSDTILNGGLMCAMGLAKHHALFGDAPSFDRAARIVDSLASYRNPDGSFPHWCPGSTDVHYSAWMGMELALLADEIEHGSIDENLAAISAFLEARIGPTGEPTYEEGADRFWSLGSGCGTDYDTRGWVNELGYEALVLERTGSSESDAVLAFLESQADGGAVPDKWAFPHAADDPVHEWSVGDPSIVRTSVVFWSLAAAYGR